MSDPVKTLETRLKVADVTSLGENQYDVFVPGAVRERTRVTADSEEEAVEKVRTLLLSKMEHIANKTVERTGNSDGELNLEHADHVNKTENVEGVNHG